MRSPVSPSVLLLAIAVVIASSVVAAPRPEAPALSPPGLGSASPAPRPTLTMRSKPAAHGGFVDDMDCSACHTTEGWKLSTAAGASGFDHDRTGFPLRGSHTRATCTRCHGGGKAPATSCEGCHRDPHQRRHDETCAECHTAVAWADTASLEQHRRTRMPLTGRHAVIDCNACHTRQAGRTFSALPVDCYACHRTEFHRADVHPAHDGAGGGAQFSRDCGRCHQTSAWSPAYADPNLLPREAIARTGGHDAWFVLSSGSHRGAACASCHVDPRRMRHVRCDGCHDDLALRRQHRVVPVARSSSSCLRCHPRGAAR